MDYRDLLVKYIRYVEEAEGVNFILEGEDFIARRDLPLSDAEWAELEMLATEAEVIRSDSE